MDMDERKRVGLSKFMALVLRHRPQQFGIALEEGGWAPLDALVGAVKRSYRDDITADDIVGVVERPPGPRPKRRFERDGTATKIRARYGHSTGVRTQPAYEPIEPPALLYHGTTHRAWRAIRDEGLQPMGRQYVHLSRSVEDANCVGRRRDPDPFVIAVDTACAIEHGVAFFAPGEAVVLATAILPECLHV